MATGDYTKLWQALQRLHAKYNHGYEPIKPITISMDFEAAMANASRSAFPDVKIAHCSFSSFTGMEKSNTEDICSYASQRKQNFNGSMETTSWLFVYAMVPAADVSQSLPGYPVDN